MRLYCAPALRPRSAIFSYRVVSALCLHCGSPLKSSSTWICTCGRTPLFFQGGGRDAWWQASQGRDTKREANDKEKGKTHDRQTKNREHVFLFVTPCWYNAVMCKSNGQSWGSWDRGCHPLGLYIIIMPKEEHP